MTAPAPYAPTVPPMHDPAWATPAAPTPQKRVVKRVGVMSMAKIYAIILAAMGLIIGAFVALFSVAVAGVAGAEGASPAEGVALAGVGVFAIVLFPILYGVLGFVSGALGGALYNVCAKWVGGIEVEVA